MSGKRIPIHAGEKWFGGAVEHGELMPFQPGYRLDLQEFTNNQVVPLLVSSHGRWVWSEKSFSFRITPGTLLIERGATQVATGENEAGRTLRGAYLDASRKFFAPGGEIPDERLFTRPQYNTWIELTYHQAEEPILRYAEELRKAGFPPGVLMIDDTWQTDYGAWTFDAARFRDPGGMVRRLHDSGFAVMLWVVPYVSPDSREARQLAADGLLLRDAHGEVAIRRWWNGHSAVLDLSNDKAAAWFKAQLDRLRDDHGVDGFKFDGGDPDMYRATDKAAGSADPVEQTEAYARFGLSYRLNEYRACWKMSARPLAQRLRDRFHTWDERGLGSCIASAIAQGLVGHAFVCPDMIGGGDYRSFLPGAGVLDPELFVRHAQLSALMPMMQFSAAPWRVLPEMERGLCLEAALLHQRLGGEILALARDSAFSGEPIVRHPAYDYPAAEALAARNQFLLGRDLLVAPVVEKGARERHVWFPEGTWQSYFDGESIRGQGWRTVPAPLERLPWWRRKK